MRNAIALTVMACLLIGASTPARTQDLEGTLRKVKETGTFTIGYRESSLPLVVP
jgi:glutamate/aspartate transport system substrate-binding protein